MVSAPVGSKGQRVKYIIWLRCAQSCIPFEAYDTSKSERVRKMTSNVEIIDIADDVEVIDIAADVEVIDIVDDVEVIDITDDENMDQDDNSDGVGDGAVNNAENINANLRRMDDADFMDFMDIFNEVPDFEDEESIVSEDSDYASDYSSDFADTIEKQLTLAEVRALNLRTKYCVIHFYYTTGGTFSACAECVIQIADADVNVMYVYRKHFTDAFGMLNGKYCSNCNRPMFIIIPCNMCPVCTPN